MLSLVASATRETIEAVLKTRATDSATAIASLGTNAEKLNRQAADLGYAVGWATHKVKDDATQQDHEVLVYPPNLLSLLGWLITAMAGSLGAPFWFDVLATVMNIRSAVRPADPAKPGAATPPAPPPAPAVSASSRTG